jgi:hypothetical protein
MSSASWPYSPGECPRCRYLQPIDPPICDDDGYDLVGFCRHPRIGMELFQLKRRPAGAQSSCPCFFPQAEPAHVPQHRL